MRDEPIDPETLAALLDGTLSEEERTRVLAVLARSDDSYDAFLEASAVLGELATDLGGERPVPPLPPRPPLGGYGPPEGVRPLLEAPQPDAGTLEEQHQPPPTQRRAAGGERRPARWRRRPFLVGGALLAAAAVGVAVLTPREPRGEGALALGAARELAASSGGVSALGAGWDRLGWSAVRGDDEALAGRTRAFRMGVRMADLELALSAEDTAASRSIGGSLVRLASGVEMGGSVAMHVEQVARGSAERAEREEVAAELRSLSGAAPWFDLGAWCEAARLAARARQASFFDAESPAMRELQRIDGTIGGLAPDERRGAEAAVERLRHLADRPPTSPVDFDDAAAVLESVIAELGQ
ncbi:MAG TPA: hypothetical protein VKA84_12700 [Gemmatimonadaceae bacterium]|nr:hypothetical protein [Gemmatimonadaceae bacterium]